MSLIGTLNVHRAGRATSGDVIGDLNKRRGRVLGMEATHGRKGYTTVQAEVPKAEMMDYPIALRAVDSGTRQLHVLLHSLR